MNNDKNLIAAVAISLLVLFGYQMILNRVMPSRQEVVTVKPEQPPPAATPPERLVVDREIVQTPVAELDLDTYVISNEDVALTVNSAAAIKRVELKGFVDPETGGHTVILQAPAQVAGLLATPGLMKTATLENIESGDQWVRAVYELSPEVRLEKIVSLRPEGYGTDTRLTFTNSSENDKIVSFELTGAIGQISGGGIEARYREVFTASEKKLNRINASKLKDDYGIREPVRYAGYKGQYFSQVLVPSQTADFSFGDVAVLGDVTLGVVGVGENEVIIPAQGSVAYEATLYAGPNDVEQMAGISKEITDVLGKGFFAGVSDFLLLLLRMFYKLLRNYGLAVIALSVLINLFLAPLTVKSLSSMREMQALQPQMEKLREQHKDNPQKLNKEMMELYKKNKVNPMGGCLPLLFQMPIFFSLYKVLNSAVELRGASFLWISDLSAPDSVGIPFSLPLIGDSVHVLPLIMIAVSYLQQKKTNPAHSTDQQKKMALIMPAFLGVIFYSFPAGLVLYFLTNTLVSFGVQSVVFSKTKHGEK